MLNDKQYQLLLQHYAAIKMAVETRAIVSTSPFYAMNEIKQQMGLPPSNGYCAACVMELYDYMWSLIQIYENGKGN